MAESLIINETEYLSARTAAERVGYTPDYIGKLAREEKVDATRVGRQWYVSLDSVERFKNASEEQKLERGRRISKERKLEQEQYQAMRAPVVSDVPEADEPGVPPLPVRHLRVNALAQTVLILMIGVTVGVGGYFVSSYTETNGQRAAVSESDLSIFKQLAIAVYRFITPEGETEVVVETIPGTTNTEVVHREGTERVASVPTTTTSDELSVSVSQEEPEALEESIGELFSDEVRVTFNQNQRDRGVIVPQFKSGDGSEYRFFVVPVESLSSSTVEHSEV